MYDLFEHLMNEPPIDGVEINTGSRSECEPWSGQHIWSRPDELALALLSPRGEGEDRRTGLLRPAPLFSVHSSL